MATKRVATGSAAQWWVDKPSLGEFNKVLSCEWDLSFCFLIFLMMIYFPFLTSISFLMCNLVFKIFASAAQKFLLIKVMLPCLYEGSLADICTSLFHIENYMHDKWLKFITFYNLFSLAELIQSSAKECDFCTYKV